MYEPKMKETDNSVIEFIESEDNVKAFRSGQYQRLLAEKTTRYYGWF
ncbi:hypothetical protein [Evansella clarkii]|nr:hypothetical protein [Evansella clarkii]